MGKVGEPLTVQCIRLATGHILDVPGIHYPGVQVAANDGCINAFPVNTGAFHHDQVNLMLLQELAHQLPVFPEGAKLTR